MASNTGALTEIIAESKELLNFTRCSTAVTKYSEKQFDFRNYSRNLINMEKRMNADKDDVVAQVFKIAIDRYFDGTNIKEAVDLAIEDVEKEIGVNPRELIMETIQGVRK